MSLEIAEYLIDDDDDDDEEEEQTMKEILKVMKKNPLLDISRKSNTRISELLCSVNAFLV